MRSPKSVVNGLVLTLARRRFVRLVRGGWPNVANFHDDPGTAYDIRIDGYPSKDVLLSASRAIKSFSEAERAAKIVLDRIRRDEDRKECHARHHSWDAGWFDAIKVVFHTETALRLLEMSDALRSLLDTEDRTGSQ